MTSSNETVASMHETVDDHSTTSNSNVSSGRGVFNGANMMATAGNMWHTVPTWENKIVSSAAVSGWNIAFFVWMYLQWSLVTLLCYGSAAAMVGGFLYGTVLGSRSRSLVTVEPLSRGFVDGVADKCYEASVRYASKGRELLLWYNPMQSLKTLVVLLIGGFLSSFISVSVALHMYGNYYVFSKYIKMGYNMYVKPLASPYVKMAVDRIEMVVSKIPIFRQLDAPSKKLA